MAFWDSGAVSKRAIIIQVVILAGLVAFFKADLPRIERARAAAEATERERRIEKFFQSTVAEDVSREVEAPATSGGARVHPQMLRRAASMEEVEQALGAPDTSSTDYAGGLHLTWIGARHNLEASFNRGRLYCLKLEDRRTGHGVMVFESSSSWHPF
jgi:hypothetical protein